MSKQSARISRSQTDPYYRKRNRLASNRVQIRNKLIIAWVDQNAPNVFEAAATEAERQVPYQRRKKFRGRIDLSMLPKKARGKRHAKALRAGLKARLR